MTNSDKFKHLFGIYATELWAMPENDFLEWLNADAQDMPTEEQRTGQWIIDDYDDEYAVCDRCGEPCATYVMGKPRDRFCKWCGAKMEAET